MQINDKPFSIYDFLGYLIPGIFGFYAFVFLYNYAKDGSLSISIFANPDFSEEKIISVILFYILGHILSFFSSMSVEKYSVWTLGYPSEYLFIKNSEKGFYKNSCSYDEAHKYGSIFRSIARVLIRTIVFIILLPIGIGDLISRKVFRLHDIYARAFDKNLLEIIETNNKKIIESFYEKKETDTTGDTFRLIYHYAIEHSSNHINKMQNYVALYGFTRTLCFIGCLLFWEWFILNNNNFITIQRCMSSGIYISMNFKNCLVLFVIFFLTFFLYWDFNKFYRKFSMEAYLGAVVSYNKNKEIKFVI